VKKRIFDKPVAWLLGKQLLGGLKGILLYTAYGEKLDPRDWMAGKVEPFTGNGKEEFWFDYLSDAGDGTRAMYTIAYLALCPLQTKLNKDTTTLPASEDDRLVSTLKTAGDDYTFELPRGEFLFVGGDTSYHTADYLSLVNRIQRPFNYAYQDLRKRSLISDNDERRPIFGIPGNHDYYDQVDGFRRQFRKPIRPEGPLPPDDGPYRSSPRSAVLTIAGFRRAQEASYVALRLPFDWWFWGLDTEPGVIDRRQIEFFRAGKAIPNKLIVATCSPSTVFGSVAKEDDAKATKSMGKLGLKVCFAPRKDGRHKPDLTHSGDAVLDEGQCRLDLSGDVHHYARYWGPPSGKVPRHHNTAPQPAARSYASVVSGSGGAFHHPSSTYDDEICEQVLYPPEGESRAAAASTLFKFWNVMTGGYVWLAGFIIAFTIYFCITAPQSSKEFISNIGLVNALDVTQTRQPLEITATIIDPDVDPCKPVKPFVLWTALGLVQNEWQPERCMPRSPGYLFTDPRPWPLDLKLGQLFIWLSALAILITFALSLFTNEIFDNKKSAFEERGNPDKKLIPIIGITAPLVIIGLLSIQPYRYQITPFINSLLVLYSIFAAVTAIILNVRYSEYLFKKSFNSQTTEGWAAWIERKVDDYLPWLLWILAIVVVTVGMWFFGKNNLPAYLTSDIVFTVVLIAAAVGIMLLPFKVAGDLLYTKPKWLRIVGKTAIGLWHLILQLLVPYILILNGNYITWALAAILVLLPIPLAQYLLKKNNRIGLTLLWLLYGSVMLALPWITKSALAAGGIGYQVIFPDPKGWFTLVPALIAGVIGAIICCLWTGWYFAVCFIFNGHNNEVGGTARIENFKEFIRFRLTKDGLIGYVIAVDDVSLIGEKADHTDRVMDGSDLKVKLIDIFHLVPKTAAKTAANPGANSSASDGANP